MKQNKYFNSKRRHIGVTHSFNSCIFRKVRYVDQTHKETSHKHKNACYGKNILYEGKTYHGK